MKYGILNFDEPQQDTSRKIIHVDMDAFYASIEMRDNSLLSNKPVIIAKHPRLTNGKGIVATCNYEARKFGIHSAMSALEAYKRCPRGVFIEGNHSYYRKVSEEIRQIFYQYTDKVQTVALDEAYLDITENFKGIKSATFVARDIQNEIFSKEKLTCSIGVSYNKFIAKLGSDYNKPNGITVVEPDEAIKFLQSLPIDKFKGIGNKSIDKFYQCDIFTGMDLYNKDLDFLIENFGKMGYMLYFKVRGISSNEVIPNRTPKSISKERTFSEGIMDESIILNILSQLSLKVINRAIEKNLKGHTISLKIRYMSFETITRQTTVDTAMNDFETFFSYIKELWSTEIMQDESIRLLGVGLSGFESNSFHEIRLDI